MSAQTSSPCRGASQPKEPQGGQPCTASITHIETCCSVQGVLERSALQHLLSAPTLHSRKRSTSQAGPQESSMDNSRWHVLPTENSTPPESTGTPSSRGGCQSSPFSPPAPPSRLQLAWGALTCHAASLGYRALLPTCREENRRVTDSLNVTPEAQDLHRPGSGSCRKPGAAWWAHGSAPQRAKGSCCLPTHCTAGRA